MKSKLILTIAALMFALPVTTRADHGGGSNFNRLQQDASNLQYAVQGSYLRYQVKQAVYNFTVEVAGLNRCLNGGFFGSHVGPNADLDHGNPGASCEYREERVRQAWYCVDRFLYDAGYDLPYVYQAYLQVRQDMQSLQ